MNEEKRWDKNTLQKIFIIVLVVLCLVTIFNMKSSIESMRQELIILRQQVSSLQGVLSSDINRISENINASLQKESSIVSDYSYQVISDKINRKERTIPLSFMVRPKENKEGLKATFLIETDEGKMISAPGEEGDGVAYFATMDVPLVDFLKLSVVFDDGSMQKTETLETIYHLQENYIMKVDSYISSMHSSSKKEKSGYHLMCSGTVESNISISAEGSNYPVSGEVQIVKNGTVLKKIPMPLEHESDFDSQSSSSQNQETAMAVAAGFQAYYYTDYNETISYKNNDLIEFIVLVKDNLGYQYKQTIYSERADSNGELNPSGFEHEMVIE